LPVTIDLVQDTVCPWCRIGKKNLEDALANVDGESPVVRYHPFFLRPDQPEAGRDFSEHMRTVAGTDEFEHLLLRVSNIGLQSGLTFNWDRVKRMPNTLLSHALVLSAPAEEQGRVLDRVHRAYFEEGIDIGKRDALARLADGLPVDLAKLDDDAFLDEVAGRAEAARGQGITGVPLFIFNEQTALSGAQPPSALLEAIEAAQTLNEAM
jgi:predicted DsbA family dithiol-disulfide isomerase